MLVIDLQSTQEKNACRLHKMIRLPLYLGIALLLCLSHVLGNRVLISISLLAFLIAAAEASYRNMDLGMLLFFLPWSPLLKQQVGDTSYYTIALVALCFAALIKGHFVVCRYQMTLPMLLLLSTLLAKMIQGFSLDRGYILFFIMLALFPSIIANTLASREPFFVTSLLFAAGIISAALSARFVSGAPNIARFINVASWAHVTRLSGYYGDANFYSAQINACIACLLLVLAKESSGGFRFGTIALLVMLLYCGLLSASKSFVIVGACEFCVWVLLMLTGGKNGLSSFSFLIAAVAMLLFALSTSVFQNLLRILDNRFSYAASLSELTTGRSDVWLDYWNLITHDSRIALFGEGLTNVTLGVLHGKASHNTLIQCVFQFGLVGTSLMIAWFICLFKSTLHHFSGKMNGMAFVLILLGIFLPWLGLDYLFFDEFFLMPCLAAKGVIFFSNTCAKDD